MAYFAIGELDKRPDFYSVVKGTTKWYAVGVYFLFR